jgi:iron(III) transport system substrate-binding protein
MSSKTSLKVFAASIAAAFLFSAHIASAQQITVYTAGPEDLANALAKGFEKQSGIKVSLFQGTTGQVMARLSAEQANPQADVLISASWDTGADMKAKGMLLPYTSPNAKMVPDSLKDSEYIAQGAAALAIIWNPKVGKPKPADWADLAQDAYKDSVTIPDPASSGSAYGLLSGLVANKSYGWAFFEKLKANSAIVAGANAQALNPVMQGAKAAVFGGVDYISLGAKANGEAIEIIYPSSGTVLEARPAMILKSAHNVDGSKKFMDYLLSEEGQKLAAGVYLLPARTDIEAKRPGWKDIKLLPTEKVSADERAATLAKFKTTMGMK